MSSDLPPATSQLSSIRTEFPLAVYFIVVALGILGATTAVTTWYALHEVHTELVQSSVAYAEEVVVNLYHQVEEEFLRPLQDRGETFDHTRPDHVKALRMVIDRSLFNHRVSQLFYFDPGGLILYSSNPEHINRKVRPGNQHFIEAAKGRVSWALVQRNEPLDVSGVPSRMELLETYVPVRSNRNNHSEQVVGVIEIYQEIATMRTELELSRRRLVTLSLICSGALFLVFFAFIVRADRVIRQRRRELLHSNKALHELSCDLERLVEQRTQQLLDKEKLANLGVLSAGLAHELNNPLATIAACAEGSLRRLREEQPVAVATVAGLEHYQELIHSEAFHCKRIMETLLDYARQPREAERIDTDVNSLVEQSLLLLRLRPENGSPKVELKLEPNLPHLSADGAQLRQVIHNLIDNALHAARATPAGAPVRVEVRTRSTPQTVVLECEDSGPGVPNTLSAKIFEPFFTTKPSREGIGLGLALCQRIITEHGGTLELVTKKTDASGASSPGAALGGALFRFTLRRELNHRPT